MEEVKIFWKVYVEGIPTVIVDAVKITQLAGNEKILMVKTRERDFLINTDEARCIIISKKRGD